MAHPSYVKLEPELVTAPVAGRCWACGSGARKAHSCADCGSLQPLGAETDFFAVFGLPRRLNLGAEALEETFHELSRQFHPDFYRAKPPRERIIALENSALVNRAYQALREPLSRTEYLLELERGQGEKATSQPPQELFLEILEIQELLEDYEAGDAATRERLRPELTQRRDEILAVEESRQQRLTAELFDRWDALTPTADGAREELLDEMAQVIGERGYLRRVLEGIERVVATESE